MNFFIISDSQFQQWSTGATKASLFQRQQTPTAKIRQLLGPGTYYILFASQILILLLLSQRNCTPSTISVVVH